MNYEETINYIHNTEKFGMKLGLERVERVLYHLGNPHNKIKTVHIAGTNGKGSTTAMISNILIEAGYKVGMYTSPFLEEFEERIQINNENIPKNKLCEVIEKVRIAVDRTVEEGYHHATEFEIITCAMFKYFEEENVDIGVIEVGLGGRYDATNVIMPILTVISSISLDHMNILGDTIDKIAFEKAGILKNKIPLILYPQTPEAEKVIIDIAKEKEVPIEFVEKNKVKYLKNLEEQGIIYQQIIIDTKKDKYPIDLALLGTHQLLNSSVVVNAAEKLKELGFDISKENICKGLNTVEWKGRMEIMGKSPWIVIDGAHNIDGITRLKESVEKYFNYNKIILILGILSDKEVHNMVRTITPMADKVITVTPNSYRAELGEDLLKIVREYNSNCEFQESYEEALKKAVGYAAEKDIIVISGSLYMIGDMRKLLKEDNFSKY